MSSAYPDGEAMRVGSFVVDFAARRMTANAVGVAIANHDAEIARYQLGRKQRGI